MKTKGVEGDLGRPRDEAYRGYLIRRGSGDAIFIEKGGAFIAWALDAKDARSTIDSLVS